jgi:hypothetical protein
MQPALKNALSVENAELLSAECGFRVSVTKRRDEAADLAAVPTARSSQHSPSLASTGGLYFRHMSEACWRDGQHQLTIQTICATKQSERTNKYLQATSETNGRRRTN